MVLVCIPEKKVPNMQMVIIELLAAVFVKISVTEKRLKCSQATSSYLIKLFNHLCHQKGVWLVAVLSDLWSSYENNKRLMMRHYLTACILKRIDMYM